MALPLLFFQFLLLSVYSDVVIAPTNRYFLNPEKPAIFNFNHRSLKLEKTVDCAVGFIYPDHIPKIVIFGFLSIYPYLADIWFSDMYHHLPVPSIIID